MAEEVEMTPVESVEPPKAANPLAKATTTAALKPGLRPGLKLPPKPGSTVALKPGLKLPPKAGATGAFKPGLKLPPKVGATGAFKPGLKLPPKPVIRKPGSTIAAAPLPKPIAPAAPAPAAPAAPVVPAPVAAVETPKPTSTVAAKPAPAPVPPAPTPAPAPAPTPKPVVVDAQGVGKLPTVDAQAISREEAAQPVAEPPKPMEALKSVTQKLKGITQEIPQQAILRKTGIIAEGSMSDAQKEAAKHKTARISLSEAMGVAPVKNENAPMKTIRIKRPIDIPTATKSLAPQPKPAETEAATKPQETASTEASTKTSPAPTEAPTATITQRKTLKIARPSGGIVRPSGKFGIKRPSQASTISKSPVEKNGETPAAEGAPADLADAPIADIADIPDIPSMPMPNLPTVAAANNGPAWLWVLSSLVQAAACVAIGALAWMLYQNTQIAYF